MLPLALSLPWGSPIDGLALILRASGFVAVAPIIGAQGIPPRVRLAFAVLFVLVVAPMAPAAPADVGLFRLAVVELLIGILLGFAGKVVIDVFLYAGGVASFPSGLAIANQLDPITQLNIPALGVFYRLLAILVYLGIGGHRQLLAVLARSYEILPVGTAVLDGPWVATVVSLTGRVIMLGIRVAAPVIVSGLLVDACLMLIARAVPQMHILIVGAPIRLGFGLLAVGMSVAIIAPLVGEALSGSLLDASTLLDALGAR